MTSLDSETERRPNSASTSFHLTAKVLATILLGLEDLS